MSFTHTLPMRLRTAYLRMHRFAQSLLEPLGITADQYVLLRLTEEQPGLSQQELVDASASDPSTIAAMVKLLERRQLLERRASQTDRRANSVHLTPAGRKLIQKAIAQDDQLHRLLEALTTGCDLEMTLKALEQIAAAPQFETRRRGRVTVASARPTAKRPRAAARS